MEQPTHIKCSSNDKPTYFSSLNVCIHCLILARSSASNITVLPKNYHFSISYNTINCEPKDNAMRWYFPMHTICNLLCGHVCVKMIISTSHNRFCLLHHKHLVYLTVIERGRKTCLWKSQVRTLLMVFCYFVGKYYAISSIAILHFSYYYIHVLYINNIYVIQTPSSI